MCDQQSLEQAWAYAQSDQKLCYSFAYFMTVKLLTEHNLEFVNLTGGCKGSSESTLVKRNIVGNHMSRLVCLLYQVACNQIVLDFFLSRPTDPVPYRDPPDGAAGDKDKKNIRAEDDDNNGDDVLFSR